jgi:AraC-like DNA-binding protein
MGRGVKGMTPKQAVTLCRVREAQRLLKLGRATVTDVAFEVGYASVSQFITTFRRVTGRLPSESQQG